MKKAGVITFSIFFFLFSTSYANANEEIELAGDILQIVIPSAAYAMTFVQKDQEGRNQFHKSFLTTLGITYGLKLTISKERPNGGDMSFPSGHTSVAFSGASFIEKRYGWKYGLPAYLCASFVGWSRIESDNHYPEDVLAGAVIGILSTYYFAKPFKNRIYVRPVVGNNIYGVALEGAW
jgi:membrane-associated phospholipid phosphatase